ncbi:ABC transporter ATP-binding protein/permease [Candidatus Pelagibacter sp.]|nr:ABC transporter ATP-binding protein/permease [Candidatus Pelagibacter sp.]
MKKINILRKILSKKEMLNLYFILFLMIINSFLEAFSIGVLIPLMSIVFGIDKANFFGEENYDFFENLNLDISSGTLIFGIIFLYILKYLFFIVYTKLQSEFILNFTVSLRKRLFEDYLEKPITFHNQTLSAEIVRNINNEVNVFVKNFLQAILTFSLSSFTIALILVLLLLVNVKSTFIIILLFGIIYIIINRLFSNWLKKTGKDRQFHSKFGIKYIYASLRSIIEIKLFELEKFYVDRYVYHVNKIAKQSILRSIVGIMPKILFEASLIIFILLVIYHYIINDLSIESLFAQLILFATAAFRIMPALNLISQSRQQIQFGQSAADLLVEITNNFEIKKKLDYKNLNNNFNFKKNIKNLSFSYEKGKNVFENISLDIQKFESIGIVGSNGSGKSTFVKLICGLLEPTSGSIKIDDSNVNDQIYQWRKLIGYVPQEINLIDGSIKENICIGISDDKIDEKKLFDVLNDVQLNEFLDKLPDGINSYIGEFGVNISGGEMQKIGIARTLYRNFEILILDEATSNLDSESEKKFIELLSNRYKDKTKIIISHRVEALKFCVKTYDLNYKKLL